MLFDQRWETKIKADPFSLESLIAWLEKQPPEKQYRPIPYNQCLLAQFGVAMGATDAFEISARLGCKKAFMKVAFPERKGGPEDFTFGAALARALNS